MFGIFYILFFALYLLLSVGVVVLAAKAAKTGGVSGWKFGLPAGIVMYHLVFWDWIPTVFVHKYYCSNESGFVIHKTIDQWVEENPGLAEKLTPYDEINAIKKGNETHFDLNQRFLEKSITVSRDMGIREKRFEIVDKENNETIAQYTDFDTNIRSGSSGSRNFRDYKVWMKVSTCDEQRADSAAFNGFLKKIVNMRGVE